MSQELDLLLEVHRRLSQADIPYMLTGSMAMNFYSEPRMTRDIDIVVALFEPLAKTVAELFQKDFYDEVKKS